MAAVLGGCGQQGGDAFGMRRVPHVNHSIKLYNDAVGAISGAEARAMSLRPTSSSATHFLWPPRRRPRTANG